MSAETECAHCGWTDGRGVDCPTRDLTLEAFAALARRVDATVDATTGAHPERRLGGPTEDHYTRLGIQPIEVTEAWSKSWPRQVIYHLGESIAAIARCGTKGQTVRDIRKASWLLSRAADVLEGKVAR